MLYVVIDTGGGILCGPYHHASYIAWANRKRVVKKGTKEECKKYMEERKERD